ncbi:MAG: Wzz/FepE/Etk N-terminal domain-containing protein [Pirellulales bacterium]
MHSRQAHAPPSLDIVQLLIHHRRRWLIPTLACTAIAFVYAISATQYWEAKQVLVVRQEARHSEANQPGKFANPEELRTLQETILELSKSRQVVTATLKSANDNRDPTVKEIENFRDHQDLRPPNGAEFGKTEMFYMIVEDPSPTRAIRLMIALCDQVEFQLGQLRDLQAQSLITELEKQAELSAKAHDEATQRLVEFEGKLGADLGELRTLHSAFSGQSDLRQQLVQLEGEHRQAKTRLQEAEQLLDMLISAEQKPGQLVAMPSSLLNSQPALRRLKDGLVDAQLRTARLSGSRSNNHPYVQAAIKAEESIREDLHDELQNAVQAAEAELQLANERYLENLEQLNHVEVRLGQLAEHRAGYSNRIAAVASSRAVLERTRGRLSEVRASQAAVHSASLLARVDKPETGSRPTGLSRSIVILTGMIGGLMIGLGYLFMSIGPAPGTLNQSASIASTNQPTVPFSPGQQSHVAATAHANAPINLTTTVSSLYAGMPHGEGVGNTTEQTVAS